MPDETRHCPLCDSDWPLVQEVIDAAGGSENVPDVCPSCALHPPGNPRPHTEIEDREKTAAGDES